MLLLLYCMIPEEATAKSPQEQFIRSELELGLTLVELARAQRNNQNEEASTQAIARAIVIRANVQYFLSILETDAGQARTRRDVEIPRVRN
jgi:hypothetical protein